MAQRLTWPKLFLLGLLLAAAYAVATLDVQPQSAGAAPLAQATATPGPAQVLLGGVPLYAPHAPAGGNLLGVSCEAGCSGGSSFPYGAGTQIPVILTPSTPQPSQTPYSIGSGVTQPVSLATPIVQVVGTLPPLAAGEAHVGAVGGQNVQVAATMTRPADTTAYAALDTMANSTSSPVVVTFAGMCRVNGGSGFILKARQTTDQSTNVAAVRWHVYHTAPTAINDNAPFTLLYANASSRVGQIDLPANATEGTGSNAAHALNVDVRLAYKCAANDTALYMIPETLTAFTPASAQGWTFELSAAVN